MKYLQDIVPVQPNQMEKKRNNNSATDWYKQCPHVGLKPAFIGSLNSCQTIKKKRKNIFDELS